MSFHALPQQYGVEILRCEVGSAMLGTAISTQSDHDEMGIYLEHPESVIGFANREHYRWRSAGGDTPSGPGDTDLTMYSLRRFASLALRGNPSVISLFYAPTCITIHPIAAELRAHASWFASKRAGNAFFGYMEQQRRRMTGERGAAGRVRKSVDGIDWKYAMHMVRLGYQGVEYLQSGRLELPLPYAATEFLKQIRRGELALDDVVHLAQTYEDHMRQLLDTDDASPLPDEPEEEAVQSWLIQTHFTSWGLS